MNRQPVLPIFKKRKRLRGSKPVGRPPVGEESLGAHARREPLASKYPVHVTLKRCMDLPMFRSPSTLKVLRRAFRAGRDRFGFRLVQYSVQNNHMHLLVEARDRRALSRGMQGLTIRIAKALNKLWGRSGKVFIRRYFDRILRSPREVRWVLHYILHNIRHHGCPDLLGLDYYTSGWWFDGWRERVDRSYVAGEERPVSDARTWLAREGWRRWGLIPVGGDPSSTKGRRKGRNRSR